MKKTDDFFERKQNELQVYLNEVQTKAVLQTEGPLLLLASPGSGKTTTMIMRIGYLIEEKGVEPSRIKAVTFSRASANDMKERFRKFFPHLQPVAFSTIHSFAFEVVRDHFYKKGIPYQIIEGSLDLEELDESSELPQLHKKLILRNLFKSIVGENMTDDQMEELTTYISYIKNKMIPPEKWATVKMDVPKAERILQEYETFKKSGHTKLLIDFDDMLTIGNDALERDASLLHKYQRRYDYVLTDESQDTSMVQHAIIEKLVQKHKNLCVVADDDQSIYSWRGAEPSYLLGFKERFPNAVTLFMEQNYRSSKDIVTVSNKFIKRNKNRYPKNMFTENSRKKPIEIKTFANYNNQSKYLVQELQKVERLEEVAILYRNNSSSIALMNELDRAGIPFYMKDADNRFFSHWVVEDILNFMRMTYTDKRPDILEKIHMKVNGYITKQQMAAVMEINNGESVFDTLLQYVQLQDYQVKHLNDTKETFQQMKGMPPLPAIQVIRSRLGYEKALEKMCERLGFRKEYLIGILNTLEEIADTLETMEDFWNRLKHLEAVLKSAKSKRGQKVVTLSTLHSAKGLEFERVYMIDLVDGIIPSKEDMKGGSLDNEALEEATRLFYVGMTRAKTHLELVEYQERDGEKASESVFVAAVRKMLEVSVNPDAIQDQCELAAGKKVKHKKFGIGVIVKLSGDRVHIRFAKEEKTLLIATCMEMGLLEPATG